MSIPIRPVAPDQTRIELGSRGENEARIIRWAALLPKWRETYGAGTVVLLHQRLGDTQPYPAAIQVEGDNIDWTVTAADTARAGQGSCELQYIVEDSVVKSKRWQTLVFYSLEEPGPAPEPVEGWVRQLVESTDAAVAAGLAELQEAGSAGVEDLQESRTAGLEALQQAQTAGLEALRETAAEGCTALQEAGETARAAVEEARSQAEQQLAGMAQSYSKGESDARYAPIQSALTVSAAGDDLVTLSPTVPWALQGLKLFGRTVQDGVPSPESPVPLVSAGGGGNLLASIKGAQLFQPNVRSASGYGLTWDCDGDIWHVYGVVDKLYPRVSLETPISFVSGEYTMSVSFLKGGFADVANRVAFYNADANKYFQVGNNGFSTQEFEEIEFNYIILGNIPIGASVDVEFSIMVNTGRNVMPYTPYENPQSFTILTPNGLPGLPVTSGGNYKDSSGQQYISNILDFTSGTYTQKCAAEVLQGTPSFAATEYENRFLWSNCFSTAYMDGSAQAISSFAAWKAWGTSLNGSNVFAVYGNGLYFSPATTMTAEEVNTLFAQMIASETPPMIVAQLATPITEPIDAETMAAYAALQSYWDTTNVICNGCGIQATALADANQSMDNLSRRIAALESVQTNL